MTNIDKTIHTHIERIIAHKIKQHIVNIRKIGYAKPKKGSKTLVLGCMKGAK
jgi:hypothetical protein